MLASVDGPGWPQLQAPSSTACRRSAWPTRRASRCNSRINGKPAAVFFADVDAAKAELAAARAEAAADDECDLIPVGLGQAFKLTTDNSAMLVPGKAELKAAGAPPDADPRGQQLPLFACMEMSQEGPNGSAILPLFMCHADCAAAVAQATEADNPDEALEIVGLSLGQRRRAALRLRRRARLHVRPAVVVDGVHRRLPRELGRHGALGGRRRVVKPRTRC